MTISIRAIPDLGRSMYVVGVRQVTIELAHGRDKLGFLKLSQITDQTVLVELDVKGNKTARTVEVGEK